MAQVSIGQVENLSQAVAALETCAQEAQVECARRIAVVEQKKAETEAALKDAIHVVEEAERDLAAAEEALAQAEAAVAEAQNEVIRAEAALAAAQNSGYYVDGIYIPAITFAEEAALTAAEAALEQAEAALGLAQQRREEAVHRLDAALQREELAGENHRQVQVLLERVKLECSGRLQTINTVIEEGKARLSRAQTALEAYLDSNPDARAVYDWLHWQPPANKPVMPQTIHNRLNLNPAQQRILIQYLAETDPSFRGKIAKYRARLDAAQGQAERDMIYMQMTKNISGEYAEKMVRFALGPLGKDVQVHVGYELKDGKKTFTDIVISDLKEPVILGKGQGMAAPKGGSIAIEIKTGHKKYLKSEKEHMERQAEGHAKADASVVLCSRNIKDLSPEDQAELRAALKAANSPILAMLPEKDEIDQELWKIIQGESGG
jgi:hypothetical protein